MHEIANRRMTAIFMLGFSIYSTLVIAGPLEDGQAAYNRGDYATALKLFRPLAEQGNSDARTNLAWMYEQGNGVQQDFKEAVKLYQTAAEQGSARAAYSLGVLYYNGKGTPKSLENAMKWYRIAASQGDTKAQYNLGFMYANGEGVPKSLSHGYMWWLLASNAGEAAAWGTLHDLSKMMTEKEIATAQTMARICKDSGYKNCN
jgi:TPR repeat protein